MPDIKKNSFFPFFAGLSFILALFLFASRPIACFALGQQEENNAENLTRIVEELKETVFNKYEGLIRENAGLKSRVMDLQLSVMEIESLNRALDINNKMILEEYSRLTKESQSKINFKREIDSVKKENKILKEEAKKLKEARIICLEEKKSLREKLNDLMKKLFLAYHEIKKLKIEAENAHYNLGVIFQHQAKYDEAIIEYEKALETKYEDADVSFNLALIYDHVKNDREKAEYYYRKYLELSPQAEDSAMIKERVTELDLESRVWGEPDAKGIGQKEKLGRW